MQIDDVLSPFLFAQYLRELHVVVMICIVENEQQVDWTLIVDNFVRAIDPIHWKRKCISSKKSFRLTICFVSLTFSPVFCRRSSIN